MRCIITPGNDDPVEIDAVLEAAERIECPERTLCDLGPAVLASLGDVTPTPWDTEREYPEDELGERIAAMMDQVPDGRRTVVNFHNPPYASGLDTAPELDKNLKPVLRGGRPSFIPVGSKAVREAIKRYQPSVGLHGHIHESRGAQKIGADAVPEPRQRLLGRRPAGRDRRHRRRRLVRRLPADRRMTVRGPAGPPSSNRDRRRGDRAQPVTGREHAEDVCAGR